MEETKAQRVDAIILQPPSEMQMGGWWARTLVNDRYFSVLATIMNSAVTRFSHHTTQFL